MRDTAFDWRRDYAVVVTEAQSIGGVATIRSLGRAGYVVHGCSSDGKALGLRSRYATHRVVCPDYQDPSFMAWLRSYIADHRIRAIVPSEGFLLAIRPKLSEFAALLPLVSSEDVLYLGLSKVAVHERLREAGGTDGVDAHLPPTLVIDRSTGVPTERQLSRMGERFYIKVDACHGPPGAEGTVLRVRTASAAQRRLEAVLGQFSRALVQGHVPGVGVGAFCLRWKGKVVAEFMHRRLHEVPHTGGVSSLRESWWNEAIWNDALARLQWLGWDGVAMMEYRWDPWADRFYFIEMNGRFWGSLHLPLYCGVDFPRLLLDSFFAHHAEVVSRFKLGVRCRFTFPKEVQYVWSRLKDPSLSIGARGWSVLEFLLLSVDPRVRSDLLFPGDRGLYWRRLARFVRTLS